MKLFSGLLAAVMMLALACPSVQADDAKDKKAAPTAKKDVKKPAAKKDGAKREKPSVEQRFKHMDKDANGGICEQEFVGKRKDAGADKAKARFAKLDSNGDKKLSQAEFAASLTKKPAKAKKAGDKKPGAKKAGKKPAAKKPGAKKPEAKKPAAKKPEAKKAA